MAVYPGSFDPVTLGHEDVARRTLQLCDELVIGVAEHSTQAKAHLFEVPERVEMMREAFADADGVRILSFSGLLIDFARRVGARFIVRGVRAVSDFDYEFQMAQMNRGLAGDIETLFLTPDVQYSFLSASLVREVASLGGDIGGFVSPPVLTRLEERFGSLPRPSDPAGSPDGG